MLRETIERLAQELTDGILQAVLNRPFEELMDEAKQAAPSWNLGTKPRRRRPALSSKIEVVGLETLSSPKHRRRRPALNPYTKNARREARAAAAKNQTVSSKQPKSESSQAARDLLSVILGAIPVDKARRVDHLATSVKMKVADVRTALAGEVEAGRLNYGKVDDHHYGYRHARVREQQQDF
jgi:hypothetical protein